MSHIRETELDLGAVIGALWRKRWLVLFGGILAFVGCYLLLGTVSPRYAADARILIESGESVLTRPSDSRSDAVIPLYDQSAIESQVEVLRSRAVADRVIDELSLIRHAAKFGMDDSPGLIARASALVGLPREPSPGTLLQRARDAYAERLRVYSVGQSRVIAVEFESADPALSAEVANATALAYVRVQREYKREQAATATDWLAREIDRLRERVAEAETKVARFRTGSDLFGVDQQNTDLTTQQLNDLNGELARARAARTETEARALLIRSLLDDGGSLEAFQEVLGSGLIQRLQERQITLRSQIADLSTTFLPSHPRLIALKTQLGDLNQQIRQEARKILKSLSTAARIAAAREKSLQDSLNEAKGAVSISNEKSIELRALEREANAQRELLETFLVRYREAIARSETDILPADARIISRAVSPRSPSFPRKGLMSTAASLGIMLLVVSSILIGEFTSGRAFRIVGHGRYEMPAQPLSGPVPAMPMSGAMPAGADYAGYGGHDGGRPMERAQPGQEPGHNGGYGTNAPYPAGTPGQDNFQPGAIPGAYPGYVQPRAAPVNYYQPAPGWEPTIDEALLESETRMQSADAPDDLPTGTLELAALYSSEAVRVGLVTGIHGGENPAEIAIATAQALAALGQRCILIDIGFKASPLLGGPDAAGVGELLSGRISFGDAICKDLDPNVHYLAMGSMETDAPLQRLSLVIGALAHTYDKVILVCERLLDWPDSYVRPHLAAIVCKADADERLRRGAYANVVNRGAYNALIVRRSPDYREPASPDQPAQGADAGELLSDASEPAVTGDTQAA
ncbi:MAG: exopolysaccharide transport family protein [Alphaproteobacteria bacterium]